MSWEVLTPGQRIKPIVNEKTAKDLVESKYGLKVNKVIELNAYDDKNYQVLCDSLTIENPNVMKIAENGYVLKIVNSLDSKKTQYLEAQNELLNYLNDRGINCPVPIKQRDGSYFSIELLGEVQERKQKHAVRLLIYRNGEVMSKVKASNRLLENVGSFAARLDKSLKNFNHDAFSNQKSLWGLTALPELRNFLFSIDAPSDRLIIENVINDFEAKVLTRLNSFDKSLIHGDLNADNIILKSNGQDIEAVIDFGDSYNTCVIFELAICVCYMLIYTANLDSAKYVIKGYQSERKLNKEERKILKLCVCGRLVQSFVIGAYSYKIDPSNEYLDKDQQTKMSMLKELWPLDEDSILKMWDLG